MLYLAEFRDDGGLGEPQLIAGGAAESIFQPEWSPDGGAIVLVSDRSGWWNLYRCELETRTTRPLAPMAAEFGLPQWVFGLSTYAFAGPDRIVCAYSEAGLGRLAVLDLTSETLIPARPAVHGVRLGARRWRPRGVSRRRAESSRQHRRARPRHRPARGPQESDRPARSRGAAHCRLSHQGRERGVPDHGRRHRLRSVLSARQSRLCAAGGGAAAVAGEGPRRADLGGIEHAQSGHSILDQPRHRCAGRELRRLRPASAAPTATVCS